MSFLKSILNFFLEEDAEKAKEKTTEVSKQINETTTSIVKSLFTKTDPLSMTSFPYKWDKEFFPPLDQKEEKYMRGEILRWYKIYFEFALEEVIDLCIIYLVHELRHKDAVEFHRDFPEEFRLLIQSAVSQNLVETVSSVIQKIDGFNLIQWQPEQGEVSFEPPKLEMFAIIKNISATVELEITKQLAIQQEQREKLREIQDMTVSYNAQAQALSEYLVTFLNQHRNEITKHCFDRLILEYNSFPYYYGKTEKEFKNKIFQKYMNDFGASSFNEVMAKAYVELNKFIKIHEKREVAIWIYHEWDDFVNFMQNEYLNLTEEELEEFESSDFNLFALSLDFYALILFKIHLDGM